MPSEVFPGEAVAAFDAVATPDPATMITESGRLRSWDDTRRPEPLINRLTRQRSPHPAADRPT